MATGMQFLLQLYRCKVEMLRVRYLINAAAYSLHFTPVQCVSPDVLPFCKLDRECEQLMYTETTVETLCTRKLRANCFQLQCLSNLKYRHQKLAGLLLEK